MTYKNVVNLRKIPHIGESVYRFIQRTCGELTEHQWNKNEWGYGGGDTVDVWCRWCNHMGTIPVAEAVKMIPRIRGLVFQTMKKAI